jgi:DNA-binding NarL/FixJ family response regulator
VVAQAQPTTGSPLAAAPGVAVTLIAPKLRGGLDLAELLEAADIPVPELLDAPAELSRAEPSTGVPGVVVVLCDPHDGDQEIRQIVEHRPQARPVVVSENSAPAVIRRGVNSGAAGFVRLDEVEAALVPTVRAVAAGQLVIPFARRKESIPETLTTREKQILSLVVMGLRNREIATKLFVAESTVKSHLSSAFSKLGVGSRNEATALILDPRAGVGMGILTIPSHSAGGSAT